MSPGPGSGERSDTSDRPQSPDWSTVELAGLFPELFDQAPDAIVVVDVTGKIVLANSQVEELFGWEQDELVGREVEVLVPDRFGDDHVDYRNEYIQDPEARPMGADLDLFGLRKDGTEFPVEISLSPLETAGNLLVMAAVRDLTDRARAEQRFEELLEAAPDALLVADADGEIQLVNEQVEELFGWDRDELVGREVEVLVPDRFGEDHVGYREGYMEDPEVRPMGADLDLSGLRKDGTEFPVEISLSPLHAGDEVQVIAAIRDMTERKRVQQELREYAERLEQSNEEWEQFAYVVSHDLQEPIRMVNSYMQLLEDRHGDELPEEAHEAIDYAVEGAQRMRRLIQGLLEYSRLETRQAEPESVDPESVVDEVLHSLEVRIQETGAQVTVDELPSVRVDRSQLSQVFQNLIENAVKFVPDERTPQVHVSARRTNGEVRFEVEDNGKGLDPDLAEKIFVIFQSLDPQSEASGEGLGLALCKKIVERHGGEIGVDSTPGKGSTFWFTLPAADADEATKRPEASDV